jgi:Uma2 family endonuclease
MNMIATTEQLDGRIFLSGVSWKTYLSLRNATENDHLRMTYDRGALEIMSPSSKHELVSYLMGRMIDQWTLHFEIDIRAGRSTTFHRKDLEKGLEPDNCYWITHQLQMRDKDKVNLRRDPPPDLVLEVDVSWSSIPKLPIYAAMGVPEVWHWNDDDNLEVLRLAKGPKYKVCKDSRELPKFPFALVMSLIHQRQRMSDTQIIKEFIKTISTKSQP